jgi:hypothetical protein
VNFTFTFTFYVVITSIKPVMKEIFPDTTSKNEAGFGAGPAGDIRDTV